MSRYFDTSKTFQIQQHFFFCSGSGGWQADGKGPSIWDTFSHEKGRVFEDQNGDVACNSYELWEKDLECIQQLGLTHYRLSFSWARLLPDGTTRNVNQKGISFSRSWMFQLFHTFFCILCAVLADQPSKLIQEIDALTFGFCNFYYWCFPLIILWGLFNSFKENFYFWNCFSTLSLLFCLLMLVLCYF